MVRKSKQAGGHMPLTHYERTKKFASSEYGTTKMRLSGDTQQTFGHCSLSLTPIMDPEEEGEEGTGTTNNNRDGKKKTSADDEAEMVTTTIAMVTPSGHMYGKEAIYEYLLTKTQEYQEQLAAYERQQAEESDPSKAQAEAKRKRREEFEQSQQLPQQNKKTKIEGEGLKRTSYWLPDMQPDKVNAAVQPPERPASPLSGLPLRKKDLRPVALQRYKRSEDVICAISGKPIRHQQAKAYWIKDSNKKDQPGTVCLKEVYNMTIAGSAEEEEVQKKGDGKNKKKSSTLLCPLTNQKIKHTLDLKSGGSGFAAHNQVEVKTYRPTIT